MAEVTSIETQKDIGTDDAALVRRWLLELSLSHKEEKKWRESAGKLQKKYRAEEQKKNAFNMLYPNTEVLRQAVYSSQPKPDVRRRFRDADPLGKAVSDTLLRALQFSIDCDAFDNSVKKDVLDMLIAGRGISRIRYVPSLVQVGDTAETGKEDAETNNEHESLEGEQREELAWEQVTLEHVSWEDFRRGPGKTWEEIGWEGFRHKLRRDELEKRFGEKGKKLPLNAAKDDDIERMERNDAETAELFKTAEVWEIWDRENKQVLFIAEGSPREPLQVVDDPLKLEQFFCTPRPLYAIEDTETLVPTPLYNMYREQAEELNTISSRINKIVDALKVRGVYDATMGELSELMRGSDNDLIPAQGVAAIAERGGIDKFIWFAPIDVMANVLRVLCLQRDQCKQIIYEITGISDIIRGSTEAQETATAQHLKSKWGTLRLQRMQADLQRYVRDIIRMMAEVIAGRFQQQTLQEMTMLPYPTEQQWQVQMLQFQQQAQIAAQQGQQQPQAPQKPITWEQIIQVLRNDAQRSYKVDIETDSTIASDLQQEGQALHEVLAELGQAMPGLQQAVTSGFLPFEAAKELLLTICRRSKFGNAVEDAIDKMQPPPPPQDPEAGKAQAQMQLEQFKAQLQDHQHQRELAQEAQHQQLLAELETQKEQAKQALQHAQVDAQNALEAQRMQIEQQNTAALEQIRIAADERMAAAEQQVQILLARLNNQAKVEVAEIAAQTTLTAAQISAADASESNEGAE